MNEYNLFLRMLADSTAAGFPLQGVHIDSNAIIFEERVRVNCFYCGKYGRNWRCPPHIPTFDTNKMLSEYSNMALLYVELPIESQNFTEIRAESTLVLHRGMLWCEKWMWEHNNPLATSFIGGSCKLCKNGCDPQRCANPYQSRSPLEALGVNVIKTAATAGIDISFPPKEKITRVGLFLW